jgi:hypothetical protein
MNDIQPAAGSAVRRRDDRDRCVEALQMANAKGPGSLDVSALRQLLDFPKADFDIVMRKVFDAINSVVAGEQPDQPPRYADCPNCHAPLEAKAPAIQIDDLRAFQRQRTPYWQWSARELKLLMEYLKPGDVIIPKFAHSVEIKKPNGRVVEYRRTATAEVS